MEAKYGCLEIKYYCTQPQPFICCLWQSSDGAGGRAEQLNTDHYHQSMNNRRSLLSLDQNRKKKKRSWRHEVLSSNIRIKETKIGCCSHLPVTPLVWGTGKYLGLAGCLPGSRFSEKLSQGNTAESDRAGHLMSPSVLLFTRVYRHTYMYAYVAHT